MVVGHFPIEHASTLNIDMGTSADKVEEAVETLGSEDVRSKELEMCCWCSQLEKERKKDETRCAELELEIDKKIGECEVLKTRIKKLELEKSTIEDELKDLKRNNEEIKGKDEGDDEEDDVYRLKVENCVLECEKKHAANQVEIWKNKFKKLESWVSNSFVNLEDQKQLEKWVGIDYGIGASLDPFHNQGIAVGTIDGAFNTLAIGTPSEDTKCKSTVCVNAQKVRKQLKFEDRTGRGKHLAPSTPVTGKPTHLGDVFIIDSDDETKETTVHLTTPVDPWEDNGGCPSKYHVQESQDKEKEDIDMAEEYLPRITPLKRKRTCNVITSDSDTDEENITISQPKKQIRESTLTNQVSAYIKSCSITDISSGDEKASHTVPLTRRRLFPLRKCSSKVQGEKSPSTPTYEAKNRRGISTSNDVEDDTSEETTSESEGDCLGGFIDDSDDEDESNDESICGQPQESDEEHFARILSKIKRDKHSTMNWQLEADMLADFGKDPELCMKAVCALYRQQTLDEKISKETLHNNKRGFSKFDAQRGTKVAEFLTDGDARGDLQKSLEDLQEFDAEGVELCRAIASRYSKQLFAIYKNREDPLFLP